MALLQLYFETKSQLNALWKVPHSKLTNIFSANSTCFMLHFRHAVNGQYVNEIFFFNANFTNSQHMKLHLYMARGRSIFVYTF